MVIYEAHPRDKLSPVETGAARPAFLSVGEIPAELFASRISAEWIRRKLQPASSTLVFVGECSQHWYGSRRPLSSGRSSTEARHAPSQQPAKKTRSGACLNKQRVGGWFRSRNVSSAGPAWPPAMSTSCFRLTKPASQRASLPLPRRRRAAALRVPTEGAGRRYARSSEESLTRHLHCGASLSPARLFTAAGRRLDGDRFCVRALSVCTKTHAKVTQGRKKKMTQVRGHTMATREGLSTAF